MSGLCRTARDMGCRRVEWTADSDNPVALSFYDRLGIPPNSSKLFYRLDGDVMAEMADSLSAPSTLT